jgi:hypothetical protein
LLCVDNEQNLATEVVAYRDYMELLAAFTDRGFAPSVLRAEMFVYANAAYVAREFLN